MCSQLIPWLLLTILPVHATATIFQCDDTFDSARYKDGGQFVFPTLPKQPSIQQRHGQAAPDIESTRNMQCIYTFIAGQGKRVKLEFEQFQLAGTIENCEAEYIDIYSELESVAENLLFASLGGRYCGTVSPHVRISLYQVLVLVFHSRVGKNAKHNLLFRGNFSFIDESDYIPGMLLPQTKCSFIIDSSDRKRGTIYSPTYPGTYPKNLHCSYLLKGKPRQRVHLLFRDFDVYFGGEHCPYDSLTIYDGPNTGAPIIKKLCGLQLRTEMYSVGPELLIHFNSTDPPKADPRGFVIEYEFSTRFVDVYSLLDMEAKVNESKISHMRGTECDVRVESGSETKHYIHSPGFPDNYPSNTTCTYIIDGLQGDQHLEKVLVTFEEFAVVSETTMPLQLDHNNDEIACPNAYVGIAISDSNMKASLSTSDESNFDATLCGRFTPGDVQIGPYESVGPRIVIQFGTTDKMPHDRSKPMGFKARIEFKTDFGIPGEPVGDSNVCSFLFRSKMGFFNSPRYPANYPPGANCTYDIIGVPGEHILIHFEQFALFSDASCPDYLEIYDIFRDEQNNKIYHFQARYCSNTFPGPRFSTFGSNEMRVIFSSNKNSKKTGNGFKALYEIRRAPKEDIPSSEDPKHCGRSITTSESVPAGSIVSPGYPNKYNKDVHCDWLITARIGYQILMNLVHMEIEGEMNGSTASCQKAVIRVEGADRPEVCGTVHSVFSPMTTQNGTVRISFITSPDKVNGLKGFNFTWTEVRKDENDNCNPDKEYQCTYNKWCISKTLLCDGDMNCGDGDDTDELRCGKKESSADKTIIFAMIFCLCMFLFICGFFCYLFKKKLERKKRKKRREKNNSAHSRNREPYRTQKPVTTRTKPETEQGHAYRNLPDDATSRFVHHDATGLIPPTTLRPTTTTTTTTTTSVNNEDQTFFG